MVGLYQLNLKTCIVFGFLFLQHANIANANLRRTQWDIFKELLEHNANVGTPGAKVIAGGIKAEEGRYPYMVTTREGDSLGCGGTLISPQWVLTSASCGSSFTKVKIDINDLRDESSSFETIGVDYFIVHPEYNSFGLENNVMLIKLKTPSNSSTVTLDNGQANLMDGQDVTVLGWGITGECEPESETLLEVELDIINNDVCNAGHDDEFNPQITESMICAFRDGKDTCDGDEGGPLIIKGSSLGEDIQVGIVSWGDGCTKPDKPGVYTKVSSFYDYIMSTMENDSGNPNEFCDYPIGDFNYTNCTANDICWIGDDFCDPSYNTAECNYDGGDCYEDNCFYPDDGFDYSNCTVAYPCHLGDDSCDEGPYNTAECNMDGKDCACDFPDDGFNYSSCEASEPCEIGNGRCSSELGTVQCNLDGGDCCSFPDDGFNYDACEASPCDVGDSFCSSGLAGGVLCNYDGGDCEVCDFPDDGFDYSGCPYNPCQIGDRFCDWMIDNPECNFDGLDCFKGPIQLFLGFLLSIIIFPFQIILLPFQFAFAFIYLLIFFNVFGWFF